MNDDHHEQYTDKTKSLGPPPEWQIIAVLVEKYSDFYKKALEIDDHAI